jgi:hypothetical protein
MSSPFKRLVRLRIARALFLYVGVGCAVVVFSCLFCEGTGRPAFMLASSAVAALGLERRSRAVWCIAAIVSGLGLVVFVSRVPFYVQHYDIAVRNAGWKPFLFANSLFLASAVAGGLWVSTFRRWASKEPVKAP